MMDSSICQKKKRIVSSKRMLWKWMSFDFGLVDWTRFRSSALLYCRQFTYDRQWMYLINFKQISKYIFNKLKKDKKKK